MDTGSHIVASSALYDGSHNLLAYTRRAAFDDICRCAMNATRGPSTNRLIFGETVGNPGLDISIYRRLQIAPKWYPLLVGQRCHPCLVRPFELGADLIALSYKVLKWSRGCDWRAIG